MGKMKPRVMSRNALLPTWAAVLLALMFGLPVQAAGVARPPADFSPQSLEQFFDQQLAAQLAEYPLAGAAVVVVRGGEIMFSKGYGDADIAAGTPVDPAQTLMRIASVSKLFTWTAVMQLVEQGQIDLDADINTYLDFTIPPTYPQAITMRHLMSHSAGFEDQMLGLFAARAEDLAPQQRWLKEHIPARVRPPGEATAYSNYGTGLAAYIVERVSGMAYDDYIEARILQPLEMRSTSTRQPPPAALAERLATGYTPGGGSLVPVPFEFTQIASTGSMSASAEDIAAFMIAHLQEGQYQGRRILAAGTVRQMHSPLFSPDPRLDGLAYGFFRIQRSGQTILSHGGDLASFGSLLALLPDSGTGLFVNYNSANSYRRRSELFDAFLARFYPSEVQPVSAPEGFAARSARYTGAYRSIQQTHTTIDKLVMLARPNWNIRAEGDLLVVRHPFTGQDLRFAEVEPLLFHQVDGPERLAFREDERGRVTLAFVESESYAALEPVPWFASAGFHLGLLGTTLALFASVLVVEPVRAVRRRNRPGRAAQPWAARAARWTAAGTAALSLVFLFATGLTGARLMASLGTDTSAQAALQRLALLPPVIILLTAASAVLLAPVWRGRYWSLACRIYQTALVAAAALFVWFLLFWNLAG